MSAKAIKVNLLDNSAVKRTIDDEFIKSFTKLGYHEDHSVTNYKLVFGLIACIFGLLAQFYPVPLKQAKFALSVLIVLYFVFHALMNLIGRIMQDKHVALWVKEDKSKKLPKLEVSAKMDRDSAEIAVGFRDLSSQRKLEKIWLATDYFDTTGIFLQDKFLEQLNNQLNEFLQFDKNQ
jgi:hypothetical protein